MRWVNPWSLRGPAFLAFWLAGAVAALAVTLAVRHLLAGRRAPPDELDRLRARLHATDLAHLAHGVGRAIEAAVAGLVHRGSLTIEGGALRATERVPATSRDYVERSRVDPTYAPAEHYVLDKVRNDRVDRVARLVANAGALDQQLIKRRRGDGLCSQPSARHVWLYSPGVAWIGVGVAKVVVGLARGRPVGLLVVVLVVAGLGLRRIAPRRLTARGAQLLRAVQRGAHGLAATARTAPQQLSSTEHALAYALFGIAAPALASVLHAPGVVHVHAAPGLAGYSADDGCSSGDDCASGCAAGDASCGSGAASCGGCSP